jgi:hypothetical protein
MIISASIFTILTISIERYRAVCHPLSVNKNKTKQFIRMVVIIWILAVLTSIPILPIIVFKDSRLKDGTPIQVCRIPVRKVWHKVYFIINAILIYLAPCITLSALYLKLCRKLVPRKYLDDTRIEYTARYLSILIVSIVNIDALETTNSRKGTSLPTNRKRNIQPLFVLILNKPKLDIHIVSCIV